jgi:hypothetical protein
MSFGCRAASSSAIVFVIAQTSFWVGPRTIGT